jgi:hypothetical protein
MQALRHHYIEHEILRLVLQHSDHLGYPTSLPGLATFFRPTLQNIEDRELVDALKRLSPKYLTLCKYVNGQSPCREYPNEISSDDEFFYRGDMRLRRTPRTDPYLQELAAKGAAMNEEVRKARFERWEKLGLNRVKSDLTNHRGLLEAGAGTPEMRDLAWEWVGMKEDQARAAAESRVATGVLTLIADSRLDELRKLVSGEFDFKKLIQLCEEINTAYREECYFATAMLTRGLLDHVPPIFGKKNFAEVASDYGGKSFKGTMQHLQNASRNVADGHLHQQIRKSETLPTAQQVNCGQQLDALLEEIVRIIQGGKP